MLNRSPISSQKKQQSFRRYLLFIISYTAGMLPFTDLYNSWCILYFLHSKKSWVSLSHVLRHLICQPIIQIKKVRLDWYLKFASWNVIFNLQKRMCILSCSTYNFSLDWTHHPLNFLNLVLSTIKKVKSCKLSFKSKITFWSLRKGYSQHSPVKCIRKNILELPTMTHVI